MVKVFIIFVQYHQKICKPGDTCPSLNLILPMIDGTALLQPFQLHLIDNANDPEVPPGLFNLVHIHRDLNYDNFYSLIQLMDMILPAFGFLECLSFRFVFQVVHFLILPLLADCEAKASFTMVISLECNTHSFVIDLFSKHTLPQKSPESTSFQSRYPYL